MLIFSYQRWGYLVGHWIDLSEFLLETMVPGNKGVQSSFTRRTIFLVRVFTMQKAS